MPTRTTALKMIVACRFHDTRAGGGMRTAFRASTRVRRSRGSLASPTPAAFDVPGGQKNGRRDLRPGAAQLVRSQTASRPRPRVRRRPDLPRGRGAARGLSALRHGEAGTARLPGRQCFVHQALRLLRRAPLSSLADSRRRQRDIRPQRRRGHQHGECELHGGDAPSTSQMVMGR